VSRAPSKLPDKGVHVYIVWPGGPCNFVIKFDHAERTTPAGWFWVSGLVIRPEGMKDQAPITFYARRTARFTFKLLPHEATPKVNAADNSQREQRGPVGR